jgi:hypothetical protein
MCTDSLKNVGLRLKREKLEVKKLIIEYIDRWIDRHIYPICPFCAAGSRSVASVGSVRSHRHTLTLGWPLLVVGCAHSFLDGWTIASPSSAFVALSWAAVVHKIPE